MNSKNQSRPFSAFVRNRYWVYFFPFLMDFALGAVLFLAVLKAVWLHAGAVKIGVLGSLWGVTYFATSLCLSRFATGKNSRKYMLAGTTAFIFFSLFLAYSNTLPLLFSAVLLFGPAASFFFIGFQLFMEKTTGLSSGKATGVYTLAWSTGIAAGFLAQGFLAALHSVVSILPMAAACILIIAGVFFSERILLKNNLQNHPKTAGKAGSAGPDDAEKKMYPEPAVKYAYVLIGWLNIFTASLLAGGFRFLLPKLMLDRFRFSPAAAGALVFLLLIIQGATGFFLIKLPGIRYRLREGFLVKALLIGGSLLMICLPGVPSLFLFTFAGGIYSGLAFYSGVFYSLSHEKRGRNIGFNESLVGVAGVLGPLGYGYALAKGYAYFFAATAACLLILTVLEIAVVKKFAVKPA